MDNAAMAGVMSMDEHDTDAVDGFSETWLTLREPVDHAARSTALDSQLLGWRQQRQALDIVELGAGTGSNLRYLMPQMGHDQQWLLVDNDAALLDHLPRLLQQWAVDHGAVIEPEANSLHIKHANFSATVTCRVINLASDLEQVPIGDGCLLTASALLDLTAASWLDTLASLSTQNHCACLFALNYSGQIQWQPAHEADQRIRDLLNAHQLKDKGFGKALGPQAGYYLARQLETHGRQVFTEASYWRISPEHTALQLAIVEGWADAAEDQNKLDQSLISEWKTQRTGYIQQGNSQLEVGHVDVLCLP